MDILFYIINKVGVDKRMLYYVQTKKQKIMNVLVLLFLIHGFLYFFSPDQIYSLDSKIRYLKYIIWIVVTFVLILDIKSRNMLIYFMIAVFLSILFYINNVELNIILLANYVIPLSIAFYSKEITKYINIELITKHTYAVMSLFAYLEYFVLNGYFTRFNVGGYRVISIFVNPNNFGIMVILLTLSLILNKNALLYYQKLFILINSIFLIIISGSKTAMVIFAIAAILIILYKSVGVLFEKSKIRFSYIILSLGLVNTILLSIVYYILFGDKSALGTFSNVRNFDLESGSIRIQEYIMFLNRAGHNFISPWKNGVLYIDNLYLHVWGSFGIFGIVAFLIINIFLIWRVLNTREYSLLLYLVIFLITGLTTNFLYLWPIAYIYWFIVGCILRKQSKQTKSNLN